MKSTRNASKQEEPLISGVAGDEEEDEILDLIEGQLELPELHCSNSTTQSLAIDDIKMRIRRRLESHLVELGYSVNNNEISQNKKLTKQEIKEIQSGKRKEILLKNFEFLKKKARKLLSSVANGDEIIPSQIEPELVVVKGDTIENDVFRFLTLYWSVPVSQGYGRRMRFLVKDKQNGKVIGLFALADPVFNLRVRDKWIGWNVEERRSMLRNVMDAFVLGAIPPYSLLLGGKLVCILTTAKEVRQAYREKYKDTVSVISGRRHNNELVLLTTTSALGKSSLYDRIKLENRLFFIPVGNTRGYGHFHIPQDIFKDMRKLLEAIGHPYAKENRYGHGPNWRMRVIRRALQECDLHAQMLQHSIERTTYVIPLAENTRAHLRGLEPKPRFYEGDISYLSRAALKRWIVPRSERRPEFKDFRRLELLKSIIQATGRFDDTQG